MNLCTIYAFLLFPVILRTTSCLYQKLDLTCAQKKAFIDGHNRRRLMVAQGLIPRQPPSENMLYVVWDDELAEKASAWAERGQFAHNPDETVESKRWRRVGENIYMHKFYSTEKVEVVPDIEAVLDSWFFEYLDFVFEPFRLGNTMKETGHYTQMVWGDTGRVGCGISQNKNNYTETLYVCNYGPAGNYIGRWVYDDSKNAGILKCNESCKLPYGVECPTYLLSYKQFKATESTTERPYKPYHMR